MGILALVRHLSLVLLCLVLSRRPPFSTEVSGCYARGALQACCLTHSSSCPLVPGGSVWRRSISDQGRLEACLALGSVYHAFKRCAEMGLDPQSSRELAANPTDDEFVGGLWGIVYERVYLPLSKLSGDLGALSINESREWVVTCRCFDAPTSKKHELTIRCAVQITSTAFDTVLAKGANPCLQAEGLDGKSPIRRP